MGFFFEIYKVLIFNKIKINNKKIIKRAFAFTKNPNTVLWLLETVYLLSKKYTPKVYYY